MKVRTLLGAAAGAVGAAVVGNRLLAKRAGDLENPLSGVERTFRWRGIEVRYTVAGDPTIRTCSCSTESTPVRAATSSNRSSNGSPNTTTSSRSISRDSPGRASATRLLADAVCGVRPGFCGGRHRRPVVVASSLTGSFAADAAGETDVTALVLICPTDETAPERPWLRTLVRTPIVGTTVYNLLASKPSIRYFYDRDGYYDSAAIDDAKVAYAWKGAHQPGSRYASASFAAGTLDPDVDLATTLAELEVPTTLVWGRDAELVPLREVGTSRRPPT